MVKQPPDPDKPERERDPFLDAIGQKIKIARVRAGLTQRQLGVSIGTSQSWIFIAEDGQNNFQIKSLRRLADTLNIPLRSLLPSEEEPITVSNNSAQANELLRLAIADTTQLLNRLHKAAVLTEGQAPEGGPAQERKAPS